MRADQSPIESSIVAPMSKYRKLVAAFARDVNVHKLVAVEMFGVSNIAQVTEEKLSMENSWSSQLYTGVLQKR